MGKVLIGNVKGPAGAAPSIGANGNWFVGGVDTEVSAQPPVIEFTVQTFSQSMVYKGGGYTDAVIDITKDGYTPVSVMPRTSSSANVVILGYGFGQTSDGQTDLKTVVVTFRNLTDNDIIGGAVVNVIFIKNS